MGRYEAKLHSESVNKWASEIEDRFDIEADGSTPTERMEDVLGQLEQIIASGGSLEKLREFVKKTVVEWYKIGAKRGAAEMLKDLMWYEVLPDDMQKLESKLKEPISHNDSLLWNTVLRYKKHNNEIDTVRATVKLTYKSIIEKLKSIK